jgi:hypothetical protein
MASTFLMGGRRAHQPKAVDEVENVAFAQGA